MSLAVAAIPEGFTAMLTLVLVIGAKVMAGKHALIRKLSVVESSGSIDIICTDKTGTLTKNKMSVIKIYSDDKVFDISKTNKDIKKLKKILLIGDVCNNSRVKYDGGKKLYFGDQTEIALREAYDKFFKEEKLQN